MGEEDSLGEDDINIQLGIFVPSQNVEKAREPKASERDGPRQSVDSDKDGSSKESSRKPGEKRKRSESMSSPPSDPGDEEEPTRNGVEENNNTSSGETLLMNEKRKRKKRSKKKRKQTHTGSITVTESVKDQAETALEYLEMWESGGGSSEWTFKKKTQLWLLHNTYDKKKVNSLTTNALTIIIYTIIKPLNKGHSNLSTKHTISNPLFCICHYMIGKTSLQWTMLLVPCPL